MPLRRPCQVCHRWFTPDAKVGNRQHVCGDPACRTEAHRRACVRWRRREAPAIQRKRLAQHLVKSAAIQGVLWPVAREGGALKFTLFLAELVRQLVRRARETTLSHPYVNKRVIGKVQSRCGARNESRPVTCKQTSYPNSSGPEGARRDGGGGSTA